MAAHARACGTGRRHPRTRPMTALAGAIVLGCGIGAASAEKATARFEPCVSDGPLLFEAGGPVTIPVSDVDRLDYRIVDFWQREQDRGTARAGDHIEGPRQSGYYELHGTGRRDGGRFTCRTSYAVLPAAPKGRSTDAFGVMTHFAQGWDTDIIPAITRIGLRHVRDEHYWNQTEQRRGTYVFPERFRSYLDRLFAADISPLLVLSFANPLYDDGKTPHTPEAIAAFAAYADAVLSRYPQIRAVEVWNEYNGSFCKGPCERNRPKHYVDLLAETHRRLKERHPSVTVVGASTVLVPIPYFEDLFEHGALANMDVVSFHPYGAGPEGIERNVLALKAMMAERGHSKPMWATEIGAGRASEEARRETARYLARAHALLFGAGVERIYWYLLRDYAKFAGRALLRAPDSPYGRYAPAPAYVAMAVVIAELAGTRPAGRIETDPRTYAYRFRGADREVVMLWSPDGPAEVELTAEGPLTVTDLMGVARTERPEAGLVRLTIDDSPLYVRGPVRTVRDRRPDRVVADSAAEFRGDMGRWSYGALEMPGERPLPQRLDFAAARPLEWDRGVWDYRWTLPGVGWLTLGRSTAHPGRAGRSLFWPARIWRSPFAGSARIELRLHRHKRGGDGVDAGLYVDGALVRSVALDPAQQEPTSLVVPVDLRRDSEVALVLSPRSSLDFDATVSRMRVLRDRE